MQTLEQFYWGTPSADLFEAIESLELDEAKVTRAICEAVIEADAENVPALMVLAELYTKSGEHERGLDLDLRLRRLTPESPIVWYNLGCSYSLLGETRASLESLQRALELGYKDVNFMKRDPDLQAVRSDPGFAEILAAFTPRE